MKNLKWILGVLLLAVVPALQSCDNDDDHYSIGDFSWDWATVRTTGSGAYYLEGDRWGLIEPMATSIPWFRPVDGERVVAFFNPLQDMKDDKGVMVKMEGVQEVLTKQVEDMTTEQEAEEYGNDPIVIYQGDMWLGGHYLNIIFRQNLPREERHRISLVRNVLATDDSSDADGVKTSADNSPFTFETDEEGYVHLELRYNTYGDESGQWEWGRVSYNLTPYYSVASGTNFKGFKVTINSKENGEGRVVVLNRDQPVGVPEKAKDVHSTSSIR